MLAARQWGEPVSSQSLHQVRGLGPAGRGAMTMERRREGLRWKRPGPFRRDVLPRGQRRGTSFPVGTRVRRFVILAVENPVEADGQEGRPSPRGNVSFSFAFLLLLYLTSIGGYIGDQEAPL